jgi:hypothetical protein
MHVASVFHVDVAKVNRDVGYTRILQASVPNVSAVSDGCCTCFIWVLHMFHYVTNVLSGCCICFQIYVESVLSKGFICFAIATHLFPSCFKRMLQVF